MKRSILRSSVATFALGAVVGAALSVQADEAKKVVKNPEFEKIVIFEGYRSEGAAFGDFNKDGVVDVLSGHYWYAGPDFKKEYKIYEGDAKYDPEGYSNSFVNFAEDLNGDGWDDFILCPHPGVTGYWYENPKGEDRLWTAHESTIELGNESQAWEDVDGDGKNELIFNRNNWYGIAFPNRGDKANEPWKFLAVSNENSKYQRYFHGNGVGDINGDGRVDLLEMDGWWEQPEDLNAVPWKFHEFKFADAASNILVADFNGDGLNDVFTAWHCHLYGLVCWIQKRDASGAISFDAQWLIPTEPADDFYPKVSQLHSMALADFNGDGVQDVVTGKRWWAHGSKGDVGTNDPALLIWWETKRGADGKVEFIPHEIDDNSGVGTQVTAKDVNKDGVADVLVGNKKGVFLFLAK